MKPVEVPPARDQNFTCWKEIAAYLGKGVRTVQRWERERGLPVRRPKGGTAGIVSASRSELDVWMAQQVKRGTVQENIQESQGLHKVHRQVAHELCEETKKFGAQCREITAKLTRPPQS